MPTIAVNPPVVAAILRVRGIVAPGLGGVSTMSADNFAGHEDQLGPAGRHWTCARNGCIAADIP